MEIATGEHPLWRKIIKDKYVDEGPWKTKKKNNHYL